MYRDGFDIIERLLDRNMELIARVIFDNLDAMTLCNTQCVNTLWRNLSLDAISRLRCPKQQYIAAKAGHRTKPFFAPCASNWKEKLSRPLEHACQRWGRNLGGWSMLVASHLCLFDIDLHGTRPELQGFKHSFDVPSKFNGGRRLVFVLSGTERGLLDLNAGKWVWIRPNEPEVNVEDLEHPFAGSSFVGAHSGVRRICMFSLNDGAVLLNEAIPKTVQILVSERAFLLLAFPSSEIKGCSPPSCIQEAESHQSTAEDDDSPMSYRLILVHPNSEMSETRGFIARHCDARLHSAWFCFDSERFLVAAAGLAVDMRNRMHKKAQRAHHFVVWDLQQPKESGHQIPGSPSPEIVFPVPLTGGNPDKFAAYCRDVIDGMWILNIYDQGGHEPDCDPDEDINDSKIDSKNDYILCFDKRRIGRLEELTLSPHLGGLEYEDVFPKVV